MLRAFEAVDAYFLSDAIRARSANELAYARIGVIGCFATGLAGIAFLPWQRTHWPTYVLLAMVASSLLCLALPIALRQRDGMRHLGSFVCAQVTTYSLVVVALSGGRATGILTVLPMIPMIALLMRGGRAVILWGLVSAGVALLGAALAGSHAAPLVPEFRDLQHIERYPIALICLFGMLGITVLFETLWTHSAVELAERARADLALREDRYRTLLEHASEGILVVDLEGSVLFASPAAERLIGLDPGHSVGLRLVTFTDAEGLAELGPIWRRAIAHPGEVVRATLRSTALPRGGGGLPPRLEISITNRLDHPAVQGVVIHLHDVTDLARAKANYQNLVERSLQGISVVCGAHIVYSNRAMAVLFGADIDPFIGSRIADSLDYIHPDDRDAIVAALDRPGPSHLDLVELRIRRVDGTWRWIQMRWSDAIWEGRPARQFAFADVTAQKELDATRQLEQERLETRIAERTRQLEASQQTLRAQERLAAVGTLAAGVAHQINNPVGAILAAADYALVTSEDPGHDRIATSALQEIKAQAIRCGRIIRSILQFSRAQSADKWSGDLVHVLRAAVDATRRQARDRMASVSLEIDREVAPASVLMSPIELEQVFVNLILNAIQAQGSGATVWISARHAGHEVEVRVEDDGPGVPIGDRDRIFDPFFTTRLKGGGTGLGLSVAHGIIEDHGGRMELVPAARHPGGGACFLVTLPIEKPDAGIPATASASA